MGDKESVFVGKGVKVEPYGIFKTREYMGIMELLWHWETRLGNYQKANEVCDEILEPFVKEDRETTYVPEDWLVKKARAIRALQGPLAAQEFLMSYVDHDKGSHLREYFLELRDGSG